MLQPKWCLSSVRSIGCVMKNNADYVKSTRGAKKMPAFRRGPKSEAARKVWLQFKSEKLDRQRSFLF